VGCFDYPNIYAIWTSSWKSELGLGPPFGIPFDSPEYRIKYLLFKTRLVEGLDEGQGQGQDLVYDLEMVHGGHYPYFFSELKSCYHTGRNISGHCRAQIDEINQQLQAVQ
jgi:hypothetical protein